MNQDRQVLRHEAGHQMVGMRNMADRHMSRMDGRQYSDMNMADRQMSGHQYADRQISGMRMGNQQMSGRQQQVVDFPQYFKQDDFGNYAYGYSSGVSERHEVGNPRSGVKGHYTYIDSNG